MPVTGLNHLNIRTPDFKRTVDFLRDALGMRVSPVLASESIEKGAWIYDDTGVAEALLDHRFEGNRTIIPTHPARIRFRKMRRNDERVSLHAEVDDAASCFDRQFEIVAAGHVQLGISYLQRMMEHIAREIGLFRLRDEMQYRVSHCVPVSRLD